MAIDLLHWITPNITYIEGDSRNWCAADSVKQTAEIRHESSVIIITRSFWAKAERSEDWAGSYFWPVLFLAWTDCRISASIPCQSTRSTVYDCMADWWIKPYLCLWKLKFPKERMCARLVPLFFLRKNFCLWRNPEGCGHQSGTHSLLWKF